MAELSNFRFWNWIILNAGKGSAAARDPAREPALAEMAAQRHTYLRQSTSSTGTTPLKLAPEYESWLIDAMRHGANDEFWRQNNIVDFLILSRHPVYLVGGWYDSWAGNTTANYRVLRNHLKSDVYLIMDRGSTVPKTRMPMARSLLPAMRPFTDRLHGVKLVRSMG